MSGDSGERLPDLPRADFPMPKVLDIQIRVTTFEAPRLRNFTSSLPRSDEAVEFIVQTDGPIPIRALAPALYVGDAAVTEVTEVGPNTYRFVAPMRERRMSPTTTRCWPRKFVARRGLQRARSARSGSRSRPKTFSAKARPIRSRSRAASSTIRIGAGMLPRRLARTSSARTSTCVRGLRFGRRNRNKISKAAGWILSCSRPSCWQPRQPRPGS